MQHMIILYNPYYQSEVIESHLEILKNESKVAFGKIKSKLNNYTNLNNSSSNTIKSFYANITNTNPLQLFLTDYANLFVAKVTQILEQTNVKSPSYYKDKSLEVENWFIIEDMREIVLNDFAKIRDYHLPNFTTPHNGNRTFALYGNNYKYPLIVNMKEDRNYFQTNKTHYKDIFKTKNYLDIKHKMQEYVFGVKIIESMHPDSLDNIISAEMEYQENKDNPLYDFTGIVIWYSKTMEQEIKLLARLLFNFLIKKDKNIANIIYSVQQRKSSIGEFVHKQTTIDPNIGTFRYLFTSNKAISSAINYYLNPQKDFITKKIGHYISQIQSIRNKSAHSEKPKIEQVKKLRESVLGISQSSMISNIIDVRLEITKIY